MKNIFFLFFVVVSLATPVFCQSVTDSTLDSIYPSLNFKVAYATQWAQNHYPQRINDFKKNPLNYNDIVFIGNSITEQGGDWGRRFGSSLVKNRGISGDVTEGVLNRLGEICYYKPRAIFILIGINDLFQSQTPEFVAGNILKIAKNIHCNLPKTKIYVQTILPNRNPGLTAKIAQTNMYIKNNKNKGNYMLIDLHPFFADDNDLLRSEFTYDGTHLTESGYQLWIDCEKEIISKLAGSLEQ